MTNELKCWCKHCGEELEPGHKGACPKCGKTGKRCEASATVSVGVVPRASLRARLKRKGFKKFTKEIIQGWFPSVDPDLKNGVDKVRIIDKEKNEYHETTRDLATGKLTRNVHEPLTQHKSQVKPKKKVRRTSMGTKGRKNVKKPKQQKKKGK